MPLRSISECAHAIIGTAAGGTVPVVPAVSAESVNLYRMLLTVTAAVSVTIQDTSGNNLSEVFTFPTNGGAIVLDTQINGDPWFSSAVGLGMQLFVSAAVEVNADIWYLQATAVTG